MTMININRFKGLRKLRPKVDPPWLAGVAGLGLTALLSTGPLLLRSTQASPSSLLNVVKSNPAMAEALCQDFNAINTAGDSVYSTTGLEQVATSQGITTSDAEILVTYVVGLYCPGVT